MRSVYVACIKWYTQKIIILDMNFVQKVCVVGALSKQNNCYFAAL